MCGTANSDRSIVDLSALVAAPGDHATGTHLFLDQAE